jgi:hypothetical protein
VTRELTLFSVPKPFRGHFGVIQRNTLRSWSRLAGADVILLGDEPGTAETARELGMRHVPEVGRNEYGTPLVPAIFEAAERAARTEWLAYVNADIILFGDFVAAAARVPFDSFLMIGRRWDLDVPEELDFADPKWEAALRERVQATGRRHASPGLDYFLHRRGTWGRLPPFALGRTAWDNWLLYRAKQLRVPVIDATPSVLVVHQDHDYSHAGGAKAVWNGPEAHRNRELSGRPASFYAVTDADWRLHPAGLSRVRGGRVWRELRKAWTALPTWAQAGVRLAHSAATAPACLLGWPRGSGGERR